MANPAFPAALTRPVIPLEYIAPAAEASVNAFDVFSNSANRTSNPNLASFPICGARKPRVLPNPSRNGANF